MSKRFNLEVGSDGSERRNEWGPVPITLGTLTSLEGAQLGGYRQRAAAVVAQ